jgi:molecular chaperone DnaK
MKIGTALYQSGQDQGGGDAGQGGQAGGDAGQDGSQQEDVVDADFEEVDDDNKQDKSA